LLILLLIYSLNSYTNSFENNERAEFKVYYKIAGVWVKAGNVTFSVEQSKLNNKTVWFFHSEGYSLSTYDWFFKVRETFQAWVDTETLVPYKAIRSGYEGGFEIYEEYNFNDDKICSKVFSSSKPLRIDTLKLQRITYDLLTAIYYVRNMDFSNLKINEKRYFWTIIFGKIYPLYVRYHGREEITINNNKYKCLKFSSQVVEGTIFRAGENIEVWVHDDPTHIGLLVRAKIIVGSVIAEISSFNEKKF